MRAALRFLGQLAATTAFFAAIAVFSDWPAWRQLPADSAVLKLSLTHGADRTADCRRRTPEELARLAPNMRTSLDCPRRRRPIEVELALDGRVVYRASLPPSGLSGDGPSRVYERLVVPAGPHELVVRLRDSPRAEGFDYERRAAIALVAGQNFVVDFRPQEGGFVFR